MIQFFQKLKARKGFTLVELIVVIAIIGVLAAILIPVMMGYVTSSRVTSADTTASKLRDLVKAFLTDADTGGYGMKSANTNKAQIMISVSAGNWTVYIVDATATATSGGSGTSQFKNGSVIKWTSNVSTATKANTAKSSAGDEAVNLLAIQLSNGLQDVQNCAAWGWLVAGNCTLMCYSADTTNPGDLSTVIGNAATDKMTWQNSNTYAWDGNTAGVETNGYIIGTAPKLNIKAS